METKPLYLLLILALIIFLGYRFWTFGESAEKEATAMGTFVRIKVAGPGAASLADAAVAEIQRLDRLFNRLSRLLESPR